MSARRPHPDLLPRSTIPPLHRKIHHCREPLHGNSHHTAVFYVSLSPGSRLCTFLYPPAALYLPLLRGARPLPVRLRRSLASAAADSALCISVCAIRGSRRSLPLNSPRLPAHSKSACTLSFPPPPRLQNHAFGPMHLVRASALYLSILRDARRVPFRLRSRENTETFLYIYSFLSHDMCVVQVLHGFDLTIT